eukprot:jgi/Chlat1/7513/Chrsp61S07026
MADSGGGGEVATGAGIEGAVEQPNAAEPLLDSAATGVVEDVAKPAEAAPPPAALREDQVANAVKFLVHPKVRDAPLAQRRSFLDKKGLTNAEIDAAISRAAQDVTQSSNPPATSAPPPSSAPAQPQTTRRPPPWQQARYPHQLAPVQPLAAAPVPKRQGVRWTQAVLAAGAATGAAVLAHRTLRPHLQPYFDKWTQPTQAQQAAQAKAIEQAAAEAAAAAVTAATQKFTDERARLETLMDRQTQELLSLSQSIRALAEATATTSKAEHTGAITRDDLRKELRGFAAVLSEYMPETVRPEEVKSELSEIRALLVNSPQRPSHLAPAGPQHSRTPEQRFDRVDAGRSVQVSQPTHYGKVEATRPVSAPETDWHSANGDHGEALAVDHHKSVPSNTSALPQPPHPQSYMDVLQMLEKGEKPPNIRDVNDKAPNPSQLPSEARLRSRPKPWERASSPVRQPQYMSPQQASPRPYMPPEHLKQEPSAAAASSPSQASSQEPQQGTSNEQAKPWGPSPERYQQMHQQGAQRRSASPPTAEGGEVGKPKWQPPPPPQRTLPAPSYADAVKEEPAAAVVDETTTAAPVSSALAAEASPEASSSAPSAAD